MSDEDTPAFPVNSPSGSPEYMPTRDGMTLRDWFAGQALPWLIDLRNGNQATIPASAEVAYLIADAMLAARKVKR